jgi:magnesium-transporting ATPase (P-type)
MAKKENKMSKKSTGKNTQRSGIVILIIGSVITLILIICLLALFKFGNWSVTTISETIVGVIVAYAIFVYGLIVKYLTLPLQARLFAYLEKVCMMGWKRNDKKKRFVFVPIAVFLRVIPILIILVWITLDFASAGVSQTVTYGVLGGFTGAWALGIFFTDFGIKSE